MTFSVQLRLVGRLRGITGHREIVLRLEDGANLRSVVEQLEELFDAPISEWIESREGAAVPPRVRILLNGQYRFALNGANSELTEGDVVSLIPIVSGG